MPPPRIFCGFFILCGLLEPAVEGSARHAQHLRGLRAADLLLLIHGAHTREVRSLPSGRAADRTALGARLCKALLLAGTKALAVGIGCLCDQRIDHIRQQLLNGYALPQLL